MLILQMVLLRHKYHIYHINPSIHIWHKINLNASAAVFVSTDVGRLVRFSNGFGKITNFNSSTLVQIDILDDFDNTNAVSTWKLELF